MFNNLFEIACKVFNTEQSNQSDQNHLLFSGISNSNNLDRFEIILTISYYGCMLLKINPDDFLDGQVLVDQFNQYFSTSGYTLHIEVVTDLSIPYCCILNTTGNVTEETQDIKFFLLNKFHPVVMFEKKDVIPCDLHDYLSNINRLPDLKCLTINKKILLYFTKN